MTSPCSIRPSAEPSADEEEGVTVSLDLSRRLKKIGGKRLLLAQLDWDRLNKSADPPGAPTPEVAKGSLTRDSRRRWELARIARRQANSSRGYFGLAKAIAGVR